MAIVNNPNILNVSDILRQSNIPPSYMYNILEAETHLRIAIKKAAAMEYKNEEAMRDMCEAHIHCLSIIEKWNEKGE